MQMTMKITVAVATLISTVAAAPAVNTVPSEHSQRDLIVLPGTTDQDHTSSAAKRDTPIVLPGTTDQDHSPLAVKRNPSSIKKRDTYGEYTGQWSSYPDGSGTYVRTDDVHKYGFLGTGDKCWTDLFYVSSEDKTTDWKKETSLNCGSTTECVLGLDHGIDTCTAWSISVTAGAEADILKGILSVSGSVTTENSGSQCVSVTTSATCTWQDTACHSIWTSQIVKVNHGYIRRRCDFHDGKGDRTVWSKDLDITEQAHGLNLGCNADCSATSYPA